MNDLRETNGPAEREGRSHLAERPVRRSGGRVPTLLLVLCGGLIILGGAGLLAWQLASHPNAPVVYTSTPAPGGNQQAKLPTGCTSAREPVDIIQQQTAQGLHLTVAQVQARVLAGKTIKQIAADQGLTPGQLYNVETQALHFANNRWLSMGCTTQQDVQDNLRRDTGSPAFMDDEFTNWFKG